MNATIKKTLLALVGAVALAACGNSSNNNNNGSPDMAMAPAVGPDMQPPPCVMNPMTAVDILNACTTAQTGDPKKDAPYYPSLAPNGQLPPLP